MLNCHLSVFLDNRQTQSQRLIQVKMLLQSQYTGDGNTILFLAIIMLKVAELMRAPEQNEVLLGRCFVGACALERKE